MIAAGVVDKSGRPKYRLHAFRHFFASWCINPKERGGRELPPKAAQTLLGHSSITMTLRPAHPGKIARKLCERERPRGGFHGEKIRQGDTLQASALDETQVQKETNHHPSGER